MSDPDSLKTNIYPAVINPVMVARRRSGLFGDRNSTFWFRWVTHCPLIQLQSEPQENLQQETFPYNRKIIAIY